MFWPYPATLHKCAFISEALLLV